jgi:hypothetical protein
MFVNHGMLWCASGCASCCAMLRKWLNMVSYADQVFVIHGEICWGSVFLLVMVSYAQPVVVNHGVLCSAIGCETLWVMVSQWLWMMECYAEPVVVKQCALCRAECVGIMVCYAEPVGVDHCEWCWAIGFESWCVILCKYMWTMVRFAAP